MPMRTCRCSTPGLKGSDDMVGVLAVLGFIALMVFFAVGMHAAYRNGVTDGYGYAKEPSCPGYQAAGEILRATMAHRWPELRDKL